MTNEQSLRPQPPMDICDYKDDSAFISEEERLLNIRSIKDLGRLLFFLKIQQQKYKLWSCWQYLIASYCLKCQFKIHFHLMSACLFNHLKSLAFWKKSMMFICSLIPYHNDHLNHVQKQDLSAMIPKNRLNTIQIAFSKHNWHALNCEFISIRLELIAYCRIIMKTIESINKT